MPAQLGSRLSWGGGEAAGGCSATHQFAPELAGTRLGHLGQPSFPLSTHPTKARSSSASQGCTCCRATLHLSGKFPKLRVQ